MLGRALQSSKLLLPFVGVVILTATGPSFAQSAKTALLENANSEVTYGNNLKIINPRLAKQNWILECQGCHRANATGKLGEIPDMNGQVSKMLSVKGGQEYLSRVNGIAESPLTDNDLVDLMNWMLVEFDPENIPETFSGFNVDDVARLRLMPLDHTILDQRARLEAAMAKVKTNK